MERLTNRFSPRIDKKVVEHNLEAILVSGPLTDQGLARRIERLSERFRNYSGRYPYGLWAPGLSVNREMSSLTETYLPMDEIIRSFDRLFALSMRFAPFHDASIVHTSSGWLDLLQRLGPFAERADPAYLLHRLMEDDVFRRRFTFFNFMPAHYGGAFGRYPEQSRFLTRWLVENRSRLAKGVRCLDTACGTGEGTYELVEILLENGFSVGSIQVHGTTLETLELFAAAHAFFPHDPGREAEYRRRIGPLFDSGAAERMSFGREDIYGKAGSGEERFDIILCNGLLGGPFLHDQVKLEKTLNMLASRLAVGGILLAADRFHKGWKQRVSDESLAGMVERCGLVLLPDTGGIGGMKQKGER